MSLEGSVDVPAVGKVKKQYVYVGAALVAGIVGYAWWRNASVPAGDIPAYTDEDIISDGISNTPGGAAGGSANSGGLDVDNSTTPDTDAEWVMLAREALTGVFEDAAFSIALGRYIGRETLTPVQADMVRAAIGSIGYPPGGKYPIITGTGSTPSALTEPRDVKVSGVTSTSVSLSWSAVSGASTYEIMRGSSVAATSSTTKGTVSGLTPSTSYTFQVRAVGSGKTGPLSLAVTGKTSAAAPTPTTPTPGKPSPSKPRYRVKRITRRGQTLSHLVAEYNRQHGTRHTVNSVWDFNLKHRPPSTVATLKSRGPNKVFIGSSFWFPL